MLRNTAPAISTIPAASATQARRLVLLLLAGGRLHDRQDIPAIELLPWVPNGPSMADVKVDLTPWASSRNP